MINIDLESFRAFADRLLAACSDAQLGQIGASLFAETYRRSVKEEARCISRKLAEQQTVPDDLPDNVIRFPRMA